MSTSSPFLLFFNTLSDRLARNGTAFFVSQVKISADMSDSVKQKRLTHCPFLRYPVKMLTPGLGL